jgi:dihydrofolate synthase / folylpolyglutamate synthase
MTGDDPIARLLALQHLGIKFGLDNIRALCEALGHPEHRFDSVIVAGTNGKGSVTAIVDHALRAAGIRSARYTSPHLIRLEERFTIDGAAVSADGLSSAVARVLEAADRLNADGTLEVQPTFFEVTTAVAFVLFAEAGVRIAVLEVGLGGRFDATNIVTPVAAAITTIDLDHQQFLGATIREIAFEKAGVIKPGIPVVVGERKRDAVDVIRHVCDERRARFVDAHAGVRVTRADGSVRIETAHGDYGPVRLGLAGAHQVDNALVAIRLIEELPDRPAQRDAIVSALRDVTWRGRLEWLSWPGGARLLVDSAHNPAGAASLAAYLGVEVAQPIPIVLAVMRDKDAAGIVQTLAPHASSFIVTRPEMERAMQPDVLANVIRRIVPDCPVTGARSPADAVARAFEHDRVACACGSVFLIGALLEIHAKAQSG